MIILDFLTINLTKIFLASILLSIFYLNDKKLYLILFFDIILNQIPFITIILILFYKANQIFFHYISKNIYSSMLLLIIYYFLFGILIYGIYNPLNLYIFKLLLNNLLINLIIYYLGIKFINYKYNYDR